MASASSVPPAMLPGSDALGWLAGIASGELVFGVAATELFSVREAAGVTGAGEDGTGEDDDEASGASQAGSCRGCGCGSRCCCEPWR